MDGTNEIIREAVLKAVEECRQPSAVGEQIVSWYEQLMAGNESILLENVANKQNAFQHIKLILDEMKCSEVEL